MEQRLGSSKLSLPRHSSSLTLTLLEIVSSSPRGDGKPSQRRDCRSPRSAASDPFSDGILQMVCGTVLLFTGLAVCGLLSSVLLGREPLIGSGLLSSRWDSFWQGETRALTKEAAAGWEDFRINGAPDLNSLGLGAFEGPPKIAFMFLVRGHMPLVPLWERFLNGSQGRVSVYIHASDPTFNISEHVAPSSPFHQRQIPGMKVEWGGLDLVIAERHLIAAALEDPANQRFVLVSESCIPLRSFNNVSEYLFASNKSFITNNPTDWRYPIRRMAAIPRAKYRKGSQWVTLTRRHAELVNLDREYLAALAKAQAVIPDESYIQTLVPVLDPNHVEPHSLSFLNWPTRKAPHPTTFTKEVTRDFISAIQASVQPVEETVDWLWSFSKSPPCKLNGRQAPCFLFARKFNATSLPHLLSISDQLGY